MQESTTTEPKWIITGEQRFTLGEELAADSDGRWFEAVTHGLGRFASDVVVKVAMDHAQAQRLGTEAEVLAGIAHPNVVRLYHYHELQTENEERSRFGFGEEHSCLILERWDATLANLSRRGVRFDWDWAYYMGLMMLRGLEEVHSRGWLHGDIKPGRVALDSHGEVKLFGFGFSTRYPAGRRAGSVVVGTPGYMSPETFGDEALDERSDLWAVGVVLYRMLTGSLPWPVEYKEDGGLGSAYVAHCEVLKAAPLPAFPCETAPPVMLSVVRRLLEKDKAARFSSAREAFDALAAMDVRYWKVPDAIGRAVKAHRTSRRNEPTCALKLVET